MRSKNVMKYQQPHKIDIALFAYIYDLDQHGHSPAIYDQGHCFHFISLDTLGVKIFHVDSEGFCPICGMPKLICVFTGRMWCIIIMCIVHIVNTIRNGATLIVECMKREIHEHFA